MKRKIVTVALGAAALYGAFKIRAEDGGDHQNRPSRVTSSQPIDLVSTMRLVGIKNLDVQIARQALAEAKANRVIAVEQFFPYLSTGLSYSRHDGGVQTVQGPIIDSNTDLYRAGLGTTAQISFGDAIFNSLVSRRLVQAARFAAAAQQQASAYEAVLAYFDLTRAKAQSGVAAESVRIAEDLAAQVKQAVEAGLAFKGDLFRVTTEVEHNRFLAKQASEQQRLSATHLAQILNLDPAVDLTPVDGALTLVSLPSASRTLDSLVAEALTARPELKQSAAQLEAARKNHQGAVYGPLIPTLGGQVIYGGVGGGASGSGSNAPGQATDYSVGLSWRIGPGGLFDTGRINATEAKVKTGELQMDKVRESVIREAVDQHTRIHSLADQLIDVRRALESAEQALKLVRQRRKFAIGVVLENIQAEQDLTRARLDYITVVAEHNKAQFGLEHARGALTPDTFARKQADRSSRKVDIARPSSARSE